MNYVLQIALGLFLVLFQTTAPGQAVPVLSAYDLLVPFVLYAGLFRPLREGFIVVFVCGLFMDVYSGAPPWILLTSYCWMFMISRWLPLFLHADNLLFLIALCAGSVLFQEIILQVVLYFMGVKVEIPGSFLGMVLKATICGGLSGPLIIAIQFSMLEKERKKRARREHFV